MNILITAGGTREYLDGVRYIGNSSTGKTAAQLTDYLSVNGHDVVWLGAKSAIRPRQNAACHYFETYEELYNLMQQQLVNNHFDMVFQAAAISDYKVNKVSADGKTYPAGRNHKIPTHDCLQVELTKQPKIVNKLKQWSTNEQIIVVAFKLTNIDNIEHQQAAVERLLSTPEIDAVAHNDLHLIHEQKHPFTLHVKNRQPFDCDDITAVAQILLTLREMAT